MIGDIGTVTLHGWLEVTRGCAIRYRHVGEAGVHFVVDGKPEPFEFYFDTDALRAFVQQATNALTEIDTGTKPPHDENG